MIQLFQYTSVTYRTDERTADAYSHAVLHVNLALKTFGVTCSNSLRRRVFIDALSVRMRKDLTISRARGVRSIKLSIRLLLSAYARRFPSLIFTLYVQSICPTVVTAELTCLQCLAMALQITTYLEGSGVARICVDDRRRLGTFVRRNDRNRSVPAIVKTCSQRCD